MKIDEVLEHPWILGQDSTITALRRKSADMGNTVLKFVAYSNVDINRIRENSPDTSQNSPHANSLFKNSGAANGAANSSLASAVKDVPRPGFFAAQMSKKAAG